MHDPGILLGVFLGILHVIGIDLDLRFHHEPAQVLAERPDRERSLVVVPPVSHLRQEVGRGGKRDADGKRDGDADGKRDGDDIDQMGSFGLWFGDATNSGVAPGGMVFHVLNRGVARMQLFEKAADYQAFEQVLQDTLDQSPMRICAYAVMPNHWHLLLWPECDGELAAFMQRLTITHVRRWQEHRGYAGLGHVYQGRYKSFPVESDEHFWVVARYVECNAMRANLVLRAEEWRWSSLWQRCHPTGEERSLLAAWPIDMPANWLERVNQTDDGAGTGCFAAACNEAAPLASRNGRRKSRNVWA